MEVANRYSLTGAMGDRFEDQKLSGVSQNDETNEHRRDKNVIYESTPDGDIRTVVKNENADDDYDSFKKKLMESWDDSEKGKKPTTRHKQNLSFQFLDISLSDPSGQEKPSGGATSGDPVINDETHGEAEQAETATSAQDFSPPRPNAPRQYDVGQAYGSGVAHSAPYRAEAPPSSVQHSYPQQTLVVPADVSSQGITQVSRKHRRGVSGRSNPALAHRRIDSRGFSEPCKGHRRETSEGFEVIEENVAPPGNSPSPPTHGTAAMAPPVPPPYHGNLYPYYYNGNSSAGYYGGQPPEQHYYNNSSSYYSNSQSDPGTAYSNMPGYHQAPPPPQLYSHSSSGSARYPEMASSSSQGYGVPPHYVPQQYRGNPVLDYSLKPGYDLSNQSKSGGGNENGGEAVNHHRRESSIGSFLATAGIFQDDDLVGYDSEPDRPLPINPKKSISSASFFRSLSDDNFLSHISHSAEEEADSPRESPMPTSDYAGLPSDGGRYSASQSAPYHPPRHPGPPPHGSYYGAPPPSTWQHTYPPPPPPPPAAELYNTPDLTRGELSSDAGETPEFCQETAKRLRRKCAVADCPNRVVQGGLCIGHGAKRKTCAHPDCNKNVKKAGLCSTHGPARKRCDAEGCEKVAVQGGRCIAHGAKKKMCSLDGCSKQAIMGGMCKKHYDEEHGVIKVRAPRKKSSPKVADSVGSSSKKSLPHPELKKEGSGHQRGLSFFQDMSTVDTIINNGINSQNTVPSPIISGQSGEPPFSDTL